MEFPKEKSKPETLKLSQEVLDHKFYANERWTNNLNLRKKKINDIISKQRGLERLKQEGNIEYEINKESLNIELAIKNKIYDDVESFLKEMKKYIKHENKEYNRYALFCLRNQITNNSTSNNRIYLSEELQKRDFISDIFILFQKYFEDKQVIFEGLWIIINILYFLKNLTDISLFLSNKNCINLYIKILDKKDEVLRFHTYWVISNLLSTDKTNITQEVIFHLYMSTFFRLYLFKNLEDHVKMTESEFISVYNILGQLSGFIGDTFINLEANKINHFINYNSDVDFNSIQENNIFLFYNSIKYFLSGIEFPKLVFYCLYGLSKLSNFWGDKFVYNEIFKSGICRKLVKQQIKYDEDCLEYIVQIVGNFINYSENDCLDRIFIREFLDFLIKLLQNYPEKQMLKRDVYWGASNVSSGSIAYCEELAKSGMLEFTLRAIYSDDVITINEALFVLIGFFDEQNWELVVQYHYLDYIKNLTLCLKSMKGRTTPGQIYGNKEIFEKIFSCIGILFEQGENLKGNMKNKFVDDFEKNGGFELVENILSENTLSEKAQEDGEALLKFRDL